MGANRGTLSANDVRRDILDYSFLGFPRRTADLLRPGSPVQERPGRRPLLLPVRARGSLVDWTLAHGACRSSANAGDRSGYDFSGLCPAMPDERVSPLHFVSVCGARQCIRTCTGDGPYASLSSRPGKRPLVHSPGLEAPPPLPSQPSDD